MLTLIQLKDQKAILMEERPADPGNKTPLILKYCPLLGAFGKDRFLKVMTSSSKGELLQLLKQYPDAHIRLIVDHEPIITSMMQQMIDRNEDTLGLVAHRQRITNYIDDFGRYVYVQPVLDLDGILQDEDRRYNGVADAPVENINIKDYDICSGASAAQRALSNALLQGLSGLDESNQDVPSQVSG